MAAQPQQPIFPDQLGQAMDRLFLRLTSFVNGQVDAVLTQMRVEKQDAFARDEGILTQLRIDREQSRARDEALLKRVEGVEATQQRIIEMLTAIQGEMREGFAAQAERHNELMVRVERLERGNNPPPAEAE